jgi:hypothetical protein
LQYGTFYALSDFVDRLIPSSASTNKLFLKEVILGLKRVAVAQNNNPWLTINATVTAGIWIYYRSTRCWLLNPSQRYLRVETAYRLPSDVIDIEPCLASGVKRGDIIKTNKEEFKQWRVSTVGLNLIWEFIEKLERPSDVDLVQANTPFHPRYFPAEIRVMALEMFERDGRKCPGVKGTKPHKLPKDARIEFDHILPHSRGGPSSYQNIQVLCVNCNRLKGASAA